MTTITLHGATWLRIQEVISNRIESGWLDIDSIDLTWKRDPTHVGAVDAKHPVAKIAAIMRHMKWDWTKHRPLFDHRGIPKIEYHYASSRRASGVYYVHAAEHLTPEGLDAFVAMVEDFFSGSESVPQPWVEAILAEPDVEPDFEPTEEELLFLIQPAKPASQLMGTW